MSKWKYGLVLHKCGTCIDERTAPKSCNQCDNFGEYWITRGGAKILMGQLRKKVNVEDL